MSGGRLLFDRRSANRPWLRSAACRSAQTRTFVSARCGRAGGLRVASTLRPPHLLHRNRFTNVAIGVSGMMARRDSAGPVNTPTCRQLRHSTVTVGSARNARSDIPEKIGRLLPLSRVLLHTMGNGRARRHGGHPEPPMKTPHFCLSGSAVRACCEDGPGMEATEPAPLSLTPG